MVGPGSNPSTRGLFLIIMARFVFLRKLFFVKNVAMEDKVKEISVIDQTMSVEPPTG